MKRVMSAAVLTGAFALTVTAALAQPLIVGPAPITPKLFAVPTAPAVKVQMLNAYRSVRTFWLSRAIVR